MNTVVEPMLPEGAKARRVYLALHDEISAGRLNAGDHLPGEQKLAAQFSVSRVTIRRALESLRAAGLVERRAGSGTIVRSKTTSAGPVSMNLSTLMPQLVDIGQNTTARLLSFSYGSAPGFVASAMLLNPADQVQIATRVRSVDDTPFSHLTTYVPAGIAQNYSENDLATTPLFRLLERSGVQIAEAHQTVSATLAGPEVAEALAVDVGVALLSLRRMVRDVNGNGVEYLAALYRPDMFQLEMPLARVGSEQARHWEPVIGKPNEASA
ncbi:GntR family transcriptional regulator [uncultured Roseobacter sp.]|uniref:GntR family transcriptional regulator n=1 Tax=uncultured Roseobacter sp. TaxID=114847 RepID=UPI00261C3EA1|nr:GntR family transcriptional regulator [uncultured Roseobacter sp.]